MPEQTNLALAQTAIDQHRELEKTLQSILAVTAESTPPPAKGVLVRFFDEYMRSFNERSPERGAQAESVREVLALAVGKEVAATPQRYYALSSGRGPNHIYFDEAIAKEMGAKFGSYFLDVFDHKGQLVTSWKYTFKNGSVERTWITDF